MTQAKHTPGQWFINRESSDCHDGKLSIEVYGDYFIAQVDEGVCQEANARLIAAAPKMYELLKRYYQETPLGNQPHMIADEVEELLSQIEGA